MNPPLPVEIPDHGLAQDWAAWQALTERERQLWMARRAGVIEARRKRRRFGEDDDIEVTILEIES